MSFEAVPAKPVALAPVWATVNAGVHTYPPFQPQKEGVTLPRLGSITPYKKHKKGCRPPLPVRGCLVWAIAFYAVLTGSLARLRLPFGLSVAGSVTSGSGSASGSVGVSALAFASLSRFICSVASLVSIGITTS